MTSIMNKMIADQSKWTEEQVGYIGVGDGWAPIIKLLLLRLNPEKIQIVQIKEKFGGLRFYIQGEITEDDRTAVTYAEWMSEVTCEVCGKLASLHNKGGWVKTVCEDHRS